MPTTAALRDIVRSTFVGPLIRDAIIIPYRRRQWVSEAKRRAAVDPARFVCNLCGYRGMFANIRNEGEAERVYAVCPGCGSAERHRLQTRTLDKVFSGFGTERKSLLHFAPERFFKKRFKREFGVYKTADLFRADVDVKADITDLPLPENSYDVVFASHVLEHVPDDRKAVSEIYRILKPGGLAILPVPIHGQGATIEYGAPRPEEHGHVRAPGLADYFDRYRAVFDEVTIYSSDEMAAEGEDNQLYVRPQSADGPMIIADHVPVCRKSNSP